MPVTASAVLLWLWQSAPHALGHSFQTKGVSLPETKWALPQPTRSWVHTQSEAKSSTTVWSKKTCEHKHRQSCRVALEEHS